MGNLATHAGRRQDSVPHKTVHLSESGSNSTFDDCFKILSKSSPCFAVPAKDIKVLRTPKEFYESLQWMISNSEHSVTFASLYFGTGRQERALAHAMSRRISEKKELKIHFLLDATRGCRIDKSGESSLTLLSKLSDAHPSNFHLSLFRTPSLRGIWNILVPPRYNEIFGLQHVKAYLSDDYVLISGANLSEDYFTHRADRYVLIRSRKLAEFYQRLVTKIGEFSFETRGGKMKLARGWDIHPIHGNKEKFIAQANERLTTWIDQEMALAPVPAKVSMDSSIAYIFPLVQMGPFDINQDIKTTSRILRKLPKDTDVRLATGYFNLTDKYQEIILNESKANYNILVSHPTANGFYNSSGFSSGIPALYTLLAKFFFERVRASYQADRICLSEYKRPGWTFHAKGLWATFPGETLPSLTLVGSPNFGCRSESRDLESQLAILTRDEELRRKFQNESTALYFHGTDVSQETFSDPLRHVPLWVRLVAFFMRDYF